MSQTQIEEVELTIEEARKMVTRGKMAEKLASNREFKKLVLEGYFQEEAARLVHLLGDPAAAAHREHILRDMEGIGGLKRYLSTVVQLGRQAEMEIAECEETLDELRAEDLED